MAYDTVLAARVREYLIQLPEFPFEEQELFSGLAFMVKGKMCINVSRDRLMCRFDPVLQEEIAEKPGFLPMVMKGKELKGYCYVDPIGFGSPRSFDYWLKLCLGFNGQAKASKKKK